MYNNAGAGGRRALSQNGGLKGFVQQMMKVPRVGTGQIQSKQYSKLRKCAGQMDSAED